MRPKSTHRNRKNATAEQQATLFDRCIYMTADCFRRISITNRLLLFIAAVALSGCAPAKPPQPAPTADFNQKSIHDWNPAHDVTQRPHTPQKRSARAPSRSWSPAAYITAHSSATPRPPASKEPS